MVLECDAEAALTYVFPLYIRLGLGSLGLLKRITAGYGSGHMMNQLGKVNKAKGKGKHVPGQTPRRLNSSLQFCDQRQAERRESVVFISLSQKSPLFHAFGLESTQVPRYIP